MPNIMLISKDMQESEKTQAALKLLGALAAGKKSGKERGWLSAEDLGAHFREKGRHV